MHAMSRHGMLEDEDATPTQNLNDRCNSACVVSTKLSAEGVSPEDYHDTLNADKFMSWLRQRLIPAFQSKFPRKKMVLILDNAKYHHARGPDWVTPSTFTKPQLGAFLRSVKINEITDVNVIGDDEKRRVYAADKFTADVCNGGPKRELLQKVASEYVKSHPINSTLVQQLKEHKYELLYIPPYESWMQPIEMVWAQAKHEVATQSVTGRTHWETAEQTRVALKNITAEACAKIVEHTQKDMDTWIQSEEGGSLKQFQTLEKLKSLSAAILEKITDLPLEDGNMVGDATADKDS